MQIIPGSHLWTAERAQQECARRAEGKIFGDADSIVATIKAGDMLIHHTWVIHGSPASAGSLRRVIYESFAPLAISAELLLNTQLYLAHRRVHLGIMERQYQDYAATESPYAYQCNLSKFTEPLRRWQQLDPFRLHHGAFRR